jgi:hypothetical protein
VRNEREALTGGGGGGKEGRLFFEALLSADRSFLRSSAGL